MSSELPNLVEYYRRLINEYHSLLQRIETIQFPPLYSMSQQLLYEPALTDEEKILHLKLISEIGKISEKIQNLHWISEHLIILHELGQTFTKTFDTFEICQKAFELVSRVMATDAFFIAIYDEREQTIHIPFSIDDGVIYEEATLEFGEGNISKVIANRETIHIKTGEEMGSYIRWGNPEKETSTCIFVPIMLGDQVKGVISAQSYQEFAYRKEHEELLKIIGFQVASAIETASLYEKLYRSSVYDEMTGIKNYRAFHQDLDKLIADAGTTGSVTLIMLDSDNLKQVNDQYGHHTGDLLIQQIASALKTMLDEGQEAYRYAGDEFMILAPGLSLTQAEEKVRLIQEYLAEYPLHHEGYEIPITVSTGIAAYPDHAASADELKRVVDKALYHSKNQGKNCITVFHPAR
ncbi:sensor domain-containing diguanylate cyclase [Brevibacillus humidisoli]|uniref:sensor domain-containing diguanylate cyclase n=1 Tax=Brevibacillus humidisoli TaxID=2895522 RepID=UPI001E4B7C22|nr:sensor domain-containing diguanylate cyclase [Brevibacillus humidisoli]UFJ41489.1 sensor domain-containing diguanylate cyclase [Brevibacillus humidisoli]